MDFVKDWVITQTLGEGAYGEVKLVVNKQSGENVAMKVINTKRKENLAQEVRKEIMIHKQLNHPHIVRFYGSRSHDGIEYIFLEYASHGELFDRIEPDVGMPPSNARKYLLELLDGVDYMHSRGIAHRDIKPENLLLDSNDTLKISDFGLATVFKSAGKERALDKRCGTLPYVAPEILRKPYAAEPADIWSCGIVLVAMLCGELPWDKASCDCIDYKAWRSNDYTQHSPWHKLETLSLSLCRKILTYSPTSRYTSAQIRRHRWCLKRISPEPSVRRSRSSLSPPAELTAKRLKLSKKGEDEPDSGLPLGLSQEMNVSKTGSDLCESSVRLFLSQPTCVEDMILSTQLLNTQSSSTQNCMQKLVRRLTRFIVNLSIAEAVEELTNYLSKNNVPFKTTLPGLVTVMSTDKRKTQLIFKVSVLEMGEGTLMDFRLSRGCGIEFKRRFVEIRQNFKEAIVKASSIE